VGPQTSDLRVPAFVRGERRIEEGQTEQDGQQSERDRRWGPPQQQLTAQRLVAASIVLALALAVAVWQFGLGLTPDHYLLVLLAPALVLRQPKKYLCDFVPFALLLVFYSTCRGLAHTINPVPFIGPQLRLERFLFAGHLPTLELQSWLGTASGSIAAHAAVTVTRLHFIVPPLLGFVLWTRRRALFYRFAASMLVLSFSACLVFLAFPSAPPWAASDAHLIKPLVHLTKHHATVSTGASGFANNSIARLIPKNPYAAIPSLHAGYAFLVFLFVAGLAWPTRWRRPIVALALLYPLVQATAVVYTGDHYVVDTLAGVAFAGLAFLGVRRIWGACGLPL